MACLSEISWVKAVDLKMRRQNRHICLIIDNFSGHFIAFVPWNIQLEYFEPNLTSYIQPLDAGIVRCFKAQYRRAFSMRAVDLEEAGESDIYKINLLEAMVMAKDAWAAVKPSTIEHCWAHAGIQRFVTYKVGYTIFIYHNSTIQQCP